jgi:Transmembrane secretion effector
LRSAKDGRGSHSSRLEDEAPASATDGRPGRYDAAMRRLLPGLGEDPEFLKLWTGGFISTLGFHVSILAMQLTAAVVLRATPLEMGLLGAAQFVPRLLLGLVAGAWVDRLRRRPLMIVADVGRAALLGSVPVAYLAGVLAIPQLFLVALGVGACSVVFGVASQAYLPTLVGRDRLVDANARMSAGEAVAQIGGPNLAGLLVQVLTAPIAIGIDALSYLVSAVCIAWIRRPEPPSPPREQRRPLLAEIREGVAAVVAHPILRALVAAALNVGLFTGGIRGALIILYLVQLGITPIEFGLVYGVGGGAALLGAIAARPLARALGLGRTLVWVHVATAACAAFVPLAGFVGADWRLPVLLAGQVGLGLLAPAWGVNGGSLQQAVTPDGLLGRVNATQQVALFGINPLGAILGGVVASVIGLQQTLFLAAAGAALTAVPLLLSPVRRLRVMPSLPAAGGLAGHASGAGA